MNANDSHIVIENVNQDTPKIHFNDLINRNVHANTDREQICTFVFEAFDELWKGSLEPLEPENTRLIEPE